MRLWVLKAAQDKTGKNLTRHEALKAQREIALLTKSVRDYEKSLHFDKMELEKELRAEVEAFLGKSKLTAKICRQFVLQIRNGGKDE